MAEPSPQPAQVAVTMWRLVRNAWQSAPLVLRRFSVTVWVIALVGSGASLWADFAHKWTNLSFTTNLISELIGAMIAVPLALLIFNRLAAYQLEEAARPRLEARVRTGRERTRVCVRNMRQQLMRVEREVSAATDEFLEAVLPINVGSVDLLAAQEAAQTLCRLMDASEWTMFERTVAPARHYGLVLQTALAERDRDGLFTPEIEEWARLSAELQSAFSRHRRIMEKGLVLFSRRPAVHANQRNRQNTLRDAALEYIASIERLVALCHEIEGYLSDTVPAPEVAP